MRIGVDAGGTFTDFVVLRSGGRLETFKLRSNPRNPAQVILEGIARAAGTARAEVVHGSTVATNALLEHKGARTAFITTAGFEDIFHIGRQNRPELYNLTPAPREPLIPRALCFGAPERALFDGTILRHPKPAELRKLAAQLKRARVESVAICLLHSYRNASNEQAVAAALQGAVPYVCASHEVSPEFREYERASTTLVNAYVGPLMDAYLSTLERHSPRRLWILQSNGGFLSASEARRHAVRTVLSGPAGGVVGAVEAARLSGIARVLGFDMGGTSTDVSLSDGAPRETTSAYVGGFPVRIPMLDIHTVGAGGGSIARVDEGGLLRVGPESAGADPGPACYGTGESATVTDAHAVLGRIDARQLLGGAMSINLDRAEAAIDRIARALKLDRTAAAAAGILRVANANMERAIRIVSVERGYDPRDFALVAFGGCGGLHACEIAEDLGIGAVLLPQFAGALSALGMLMADRVRDYAAGVLHRPDVERAFRLLERSARKDLRGATLIRSADIRYAGQSYELNVPWHAAGPALPFHREHERVYGYSNPQQPIEIVTIRVRATIKTGKPCLHRAPSAGRPSIELRRVFTGGRWREIPVWRREQLPSRSREGPALILDYGSTTLIPPGWKFHQDDAGNVLVRRKA